MKDLKGYQRDVVRADWPALWPVVNPWEHRIGGTPNRVALDVIAWSALQSIDGGYYRWRSALLIPQLWCYDQFFYIQLGRFVGGQDGR